jgi:hypothetical protein
MMLTDLGSCPTNEHAHDYRQCGFAGCVDLRVWAKANRYRFRLEASYQAEDSSHVKGDGRWYVEVICRNGLIYPRGGMDLLCYTKSGAVLTIAELLEAEPVQTDGKARVFRFHVDRLDEVAAILKPKRLPGKAELTPEHREKLNQYAFRPGANGPRNYAKP